MKGHRALPPACASSPRRHSATAFSSPLPPHRPSPSSSPHRASLSSCILSDDVVSQVLGKEHRGQVRGLSGGIIPTRVNASVIGKQTTTQLREEMKKQNKRHEDEINTLKQQLKDLQIFVFNMQTNNRGHSSERVPSNSMYKLQYSSSSNLSGGNRCVNITGASVKSFTKASTSHMDGSSGKGKKCKLLYCMGNGEVVVEVEVDCIYPQVVVHHMSLGPDC
ncbi:hypothetical protein ACOSP7_014126 [Xanthoceras sorbifolium]